MEGKWIALFTVIHVFCMYGGEWGPYQGGSEEVKTFALCMCVFLSAMCVTLV